MSNLENSLRAQQEELQQLLEATQIDVRRAEINQLLTMVEGELYSLNQDQIEVDDIRQAHTVCREVRERIALLKADPNYAGKSGVIKKDSEESE